jgi:hypothetical protein
VPPNVLEGFLEKAQISSKVHYVQLCSLLALVGSITTISGHCDRRLRAHGLSYAFADDCDDTMTESGDQQHADGPRIAFF